MALSMMGTAGLEWEGKAASMTSTAHNDIGVPGLDVSDGLQLGKLLGTILGVALVLLPVVALVRVVEQVVGPGIPIDAAGLVGPRTGAFARRFTR